MISQLRGDAQSGNPLGQATSCYPERAFWEKQRDEFDDSQRDTLDLLRSLANRPSAPAAVQEDPLFSINLRPFIATTTQDSFGNFLTTFVDLFSQSPGETITGATVSIPTSNVSEISASYMSVAGGIPTKGFELGVEVGLHKGPKLVAEGFRSDDGSDGIAGGVSVGNRTVVLGIEPVFSPSPELEKIDETLQRWAIGQGLPQLAD